MYRLLIVDDEALIRRGLVSRLGHLGLRFLEIRESATGKDALACLKEYPADIIITDIRMPDMDGLSFIEHARASLPHDLPLPKFILLSGYAEFRYAEKAIRLGVISYLLKPLSGNDLKSAIAQAESQLQNEEQLRALRQNPEEYHGPPLGSARLSGENQNLSPGNLAPSPDETRLPQPSSLQKSERPLPISPRGELYMPTAQLNMLDRYLETREIDKIRGCLTEILGGDRDRPYPLSYLRMLWVRVLNLLFRSFGAEMLEGENGALLNRSVAMPEDPRQVRELVDRYLRMVMICMEQQSSEDTRARDKVKLSVEYIHRHFAAELSVNGLADKYGMSPNYFSSLFKKETQLSPGNYIMKVRMQAAGELLTRTTLTVGEVAKAVGYEDGHYFYRVFKKWTGVTPVRYRQEKKSH